MDAGWVDIIKAALSIIPTTLVAYATLRQSRKNAKTTEAIVEQIDDRSRSLADKSDELHRLSNGNLTALREQVDLSATRLVEANDRIVRLEKILTQKVTEESQDARPETTGD